MRQPDDQALLLDMLMLARRVRERTERLSRDSFAADDNLQLATMHLIQSIGEAASRTSQPFRTSLPQIEWTGIIGMRHRLVHDYLRVSIDVVWATAIDDIPALIAILEQLVTPEEPEGSA
jgi:uncharacterized protein with HEPN domain